MFNGAKSILILACLFTGVICSSFVKEGHIFVSKQLLEGCLAIDDGALYYTEIGQGVPIIVVHGGPGLDQGYLQPQLFQLATTHRLIFYDQRGSGKSLHTPLDEEHISIHQFIDDLEALRRELCLEKFILMGHSWGGFLAMLDGFDLGVGTLHLYTKKDQERRIFLNAIGPVWDGNEVWLVIAVGGMFAGFPFAYATLLSAFYIPLYFLVFALIFRAVAIEFRSKVTHTYWRSTWDVLFFCASFLIAISVGITLGNLVQGIPLDENYDYTGGVILTFLRPYPLLVGLLTLALFQLHGVLFLIMKTEEALQQKLIRWLRPSMIFFIITYAITTMVTLIYQNHMVQLIKERPYLFFVALGNMLVIANIPREVDKKNYGWAFISSCLNIALLLVLFGIGSFPFIIRSSIEPLSNSITIMNAAASSHTLFILTIIVIIGLPLVFAYGFFIYRLFRGKVKLDHMSY